MSDDNLGLLVEFKAKYDAVTGAFSSIAQGNQKLQADNKKTEHSFEQISETAKSSAETIKHAFETIVIGYGVDKLFEGFDKTADAINHTIDTARGLGIATDQFEKLSFAAAQGGLSADDLGNSLKRFDVNVGKAVTGNQQAIDSFKEIGITVDQLKGKDVASQYILAANAAGKLKDANVAADVGMQLFGRNYTQALKLGRSGIDDSIKGFDKLHSTLSETQENAVQQFRVAKVTFDTVFDGLLRKITADLSPEFTKLTNEFNTFIESSGGIDNVASTVAENLSAIVENTANAFKGIAGIIGPMLTLLGSLVSETKAFASSFSDTMSNGNTNAHSSTPDKTDFFADLIGYGHSWSGKDGKGIPNFFQHIPLANLIRGPSNPYFSDYDPNSNTPGNGGASFIPKIPGTNTEFIQRGVGSTTNPYEQGGGSLGSILAGATAVETGSKKLANSLDGLTDAVIKSKDKITGAFESLDQKGTTDELNKIFAIVNSGPVKPDAPSGDFEKFAADLVKDLKSGDISSSTAFNPAFNNLKKLQGANDLNGFNTTGEQGALDEILKYANSLGVNLQQKEVGLGLSKVGKNNLSAIGVNAADIAGDAVDAAASAPKPIKVEVSVEASKDFIIKILQSSDFETKVGNSIGDIVSRAAQYGANS